MALAHADVRRLGHVDETSDCVTVGLSPNTFDTFPRNANESFLTFGENFDTNVSYTLTAASSYVPK